MRVLLASLPLILVATAAMADRKAADSCAAGLPPVSKQIYDGTMASGPTPATGRSIVKSQTEKLVAQGKLSMMQARPAAEAAGKCLELLAN
jgi:hypothetical protein